ncbi:MAG: enoyl-CoA hydratase [Alphaproteobacteria bacterium]|nr:MAG: enoyl-CoA hydratase [Alphaproteobacteria bacterium]
MDFETLKYEVKDKVATITLSRPDRMNAFTRTMMDDLIAAFDAVDADDDVRAVVVTGEGRAFCAGADLGAGGETFSRKDVAEGEISLSDQRVRDGGGRVTLRIFECKKPVIAAVNGAAVGIGATMQLAMDIRLASDKARFGFVFSRRGIVPEACSSWFLPRIVGISQALEWTYSGQVFDAEEALKGGLVKEIVPQDQLLDRAYEIAHEIVENTSPVSVALIRQMLWRMLGADHPMEAHKVDSRGIFVLGRSADVAEGVTSFLEKRPPNFTSKPSQDMPDYYPWWDEPEYK